MDIEIENLLIKVVSQPPQTETTTAPLPNQQLGTEQLVEQCVAQVIRQLQRRAGD